MNQGRLSAADAYTHRIFRSFGLMMIVNGVIGVIGAITVSLYQILISTALQLNTPLEIVQQYVIINMIISIIMLLLGIFVRALLASALISTAHTSDFRILRTCGYIMIFLIGIEILRFLFYAFFFGFLSQFVSQPQRIVIDLGAVIFFNTPLLVFYISLLQFTRLLDARQVMSPTASSFTVYPVLMIVLLFLILVANRFFQPYSSLLNLFPPILWIFFGFKLRAFEFIPNEPQIGYY